MKLIYKKIQITESISLPWNFNAVQLIPEWMLLVGIALDRGLDDKGRKYQIDLIVALDLTTFKSVGKFEGLVTNDSRQLFANKDFIERDLYGEDLGFRHLYIYEFTSWKYWFQHLKVRRTFGGQIVYCIGKKIEITHNLENDTLVFFAGETPYLAKYRFCITQLSLGLGSETPFRNFDFFPNFVYDMSKKGYANYTEE